ncbi:MAG: DUF1343 domain-containing protein, partial [Bacteroidota bacterium]
FQEQSNLIRGKRLGVVTNQSALLADGRHLVDALLERKDVQVVALFGPEHGIRGSAPDRKGVRNEVDRQTHLPVYSLFGRIVKPTKRMLDGIDVLLFDIQDVGARFYTYSTTLALTMEAAAEKGIPYIVLDRPNPIRGVWTEGPVLEQSLKSFVGWLPIPIVHGMTIGELALMINAEGWLAKGRKAKVHVVRMKNWKRSMWFDQTGARWVKPSPSIRSLRTAVVYPGTCLIEGTNVSEGRGSEHPFEYIGAPWISGRALAAELNSHGLPGVRFEEIKFVPKGTRALTTQPKYESQVCGGVCLKVTHRAAFKPVRTGLYLLYALHKLYPKDLKIKARRFDELAGVSAVRRSINKNFHPEEIIASWEKSLRAFDIRRERFLLYS